MAGMQGLSAAIRREGAIPPRRELPAAPTLRAADAAQAVYDSDLLDSVAVGYDPDNYHAWQSPGRDVATFVKGYDSFDSLKVAVDDGHEIGLEIHAWLSIVPHMTTTGDHS